MKKTIQDIISQNILMHQHILKDELIMEGIIKVVESSKSTLSRKNKLMICGNGGSAADAQHMAAELVGRFQKERKGLAAIALNTDTSILTAWANDYDYGSVFKRQIEALGQEGDVLIGISTSGNSKNVLQAFEYAQKHGIVTIGLLGRDGGSIKELADIAIVVPKQCTARVQEAHITIIHIICELIEGVICDEK